MAHRVYLEEESCQISSRSDLMEKNNNNKISSDMGSIPSRHIQTGVEQQIQQIIFVKFCIHMINHNETTVSNSACNRILKVNNAN